MSSWKPGNTCVEYFWQVVTPNVIVSVEHYAEALRVAGNVKGKVRLCKKYYHNGVGRALTGEWYAYPHDNHLPRTFDDGPVIPARFFEEMRQLHQKGG